MMISNSMCPPTSGKGNCPTVVALDTRHVDEESFAVRDRSGRKKQDARRRTARRTSELNPRRSRPCHRSGCRRRHASAGTRRYLASWLGTAGSFSGVAEARFDCSFVCGTLHKRTGYFLALFLLEFSYWLNGAFSTMQFAGQRSQRYKEWGRPPRLPIRPSEARRERFAARPPGEARRRLTAGWPIRGCGKGGLAGA